MLELFQEFPPAPFFSAPRPLLNPRLPLAGRRAVPHVLPPLRMTHKIFFSPNPRQQSFRPLVFDAGRIVFAVSYSLMAPTPRRSSFPFLEWCEEARFLRTIGNIPFFFQQPICGVRNKWNPPTPPPSLCDFCLPRGLSRPGPPFFFDPCSACCTLVRPPHGPATDWLPPLSCEYRQTFTRSC